jgi:hypothetical protein
VALTLSPFVRVPDWQVAWRFNCTQHPQERGAHYKLFQRKFGEVPMISDASEAAIDQIVASCNGDIRGALKALLRVNEQLEAELAQFYAAVGLDGMARGSNAVH